MSAMKHKTCPGSPLCTHTQGSKVKLTLLFKLGGTPAGSERGQKVLNVQRGFKDHGEFMGTLITKKEVISKNGGSEASGKHTFIYNDHVCGLSSMEIHS